MNKLLLLLLLSSCSLTYQYKTKDIKKSFKKYQKEMKKINKKIAKDIQYQETIINELDQYKVSQDIITPLKEKNLDCKKINEKVIQEDKRFIAEYESLNLKGKYISSKEKKRFDSIKGFEKTAKKSMSTMEKILKEYQNTRMKFYDILKKENYKLVKTKTVKKQFTKANKAFTKQFNKTKKEINKFVKKVKKHKHKNKNKVLNETKNLKAILKEMGSSRDRVKSEVIAFDKKFGNYKEIIHGKNSPTFNSLERINGEVKILQKHSKQFKKVVQKINKLIKE